MGYDFGSGETAIILGIGWIIVAFGFMLVPPILMNYEATQFDEKISFAHSSHLKSLKTQLNFITHENEQHLWMYYFISTFEEKSGFVSLVLPFEGEFVSGDGWESKKLDSGPTVLFKNFVCTEESCPNNSGYVTFNFLKPIDSFRLPYQYIQLPFSTHSQNDDVDKFVETLTPNGTDTDYGWRDVDTEITIIFDDKFDDWLSQPTSKIKSRIKDSGDTNIILSWNLEEDDSLFTAKYTRESDRAYADMRQMFMGVGFGAGISLIAAGVALTKSEEGQSLLKRFIKVERHMQDANTSFSLKHYEEAKNSYDLAIKIDKKNTDPHLLAGNSFYEMKRYVDAIPYYEKILEIKPDHIGALNNIGACNAGLKQYEHAFGYYEKALEVNPNHLDTINNMGSMLLDLELPEIALPFFEEVIKEEKETPKILANKGKALRALKRFPEAIECFDQALEIERNFTDAFLGKGKTLYDKKDFQNAILCYEQVLKIDPAQFECLFNLSLCYLQLEDNDNAIKFAREFLSTKSFHIDALNTLGIALAKKDEHEEAIKNYNLILDKEKDHKDALYNKALSLMLSNRSDLAIPLFDAVLKQDPKNVGTILNKGNCFMNLNKISEAIVEFNNALSIEPSNADAVMLKQKAEEKLNQS